MVYIVSLPAFHAICPETIATTTDDNTSRPCWTRATDFAERLFDRESSIVYRISRAPAAGRAIKAKSGTLLIGHALYTTAAAAAS